MSSFVASSSRVKSCNLSLSASPLPPPQRACRHTIHCLPHRPWLPAQPILHGVDLQSSCETRLVDSLSDSVFFPILKSSLPCYVFILKIHSGFPAENVRKYCMYCSQVVFYKAYFTWGRSTVIMRDKTCRLTVRLCIFPDFKKLSSMLCFHTKDTQCVSCRKC